MSRAAVLGHPIEHSRSPLLHSTAYALLGAQIDYGRMDAEGLRAADVAQRLRTEPGWVGLSVTMPMKQDMLAQMDSAEPLATQMGALNTVVVRRDAATGRVSLHGSNTDVVGVRQALAHAGATSLAGQRCLLLGGGGTAAAALAGVSLLGCTDVVLAVRDPSRTDALSRLAGALGLTLTVITLGALNTLNTPGSTPRRAPRVVVSTLPPRAADAYAADVAALCAPGAVLLDVAYEPWPSAVASAWAGAGGVVVHGLAMLVHQAVEQIALFSGDERAREPRILRALCDAADITERGEARSAVGG